MPSTRPQKDLPRRGSVHRSPGRGTVRDALDADIADLVRQGRKDTAANIEPCFDRTVDDRFGTIPLDALTREDFDGWRDRPRDGGRHRRRARHEPGIVPRRPADHRPAIVVRYRENPVLGLDRPEELHAPDGIAAPGRDDLRARRHARRYGVQDTALRGPS